MDKNSYTFLIINSPADDLDYLDMLVHQKPFNFDSILVLGNLLPADKICLNIEDETSYVESIAFLSILKSKLSALSHRVIYIPSDNLPNFEYTQPKHLAAVDQVVFNITNSAMRFDDNLLVINFDEKNLEKNEKILENKIFLENLSKNLNAETQKNPAKKELDNALLSAFEQSQRYAPLLYSFSSEEYLTDLKEKFGVSAQNFKKDFLVSREILQNFEKEKIFLPEKKNVKFYSNFQSISLIFSDEKLQKIDKDDFLVILSNEKISQNFGPQKNIVINSNNLKSFSEKIVYSLKLQKISGKWEISENLQEFLI